MVFKLKHASESSEELVKTQKARPHPLTQYLQWRSKNLHFYQMPRPYWCCWSNNHTLKISDLIIFTNNMLFMSYTQNHTSNCSNLSIYKCTLCQQLSNFFYWTTDNLLWSVSSSLSCYTSTKNVKLPKR